MKENSIIYDKVAEEMKDLHAQYKSLKEAENKILVQGDTLPKDNKRKKIEKVACYMTGYIIQYYHQI